MKAAALGLLTAFLPAAGQDASALQAPIDQAPKGGTATLPAGTFAVSETLKGKPGEYRVTLLALDETGRGARAEKRIRVEP